MGAPSQNLTHALCASGLKACVCADAVMFPMGVWLRQFLSTRSPFLGGMKGSGRFTQQSCPQKIYNSSAKGSQQFHMRTLTTINMGPRAVLALCLVATCSKHDVWVCVAIPPKAAPHEWLSGTKVKRGAFRATHTLSIHLARPQRVKGSTAT